MFLEPLEQRAMMAVVDLSASGPQIGAHNGALFSEINLGGAGSGNIDAFVRIETNQPVKEGYNSSARPVQFQEANSPTFNRDLALTEIPIVVIGGIAYREFLLDTNEMSSGDEPLISLNRIEVYQSAAGGLNQYPFTDATGPAATLIYDMDAGTDSNDETAPSSDGNWVLIDNDEGTGSGNTNMFLYVPNAVFGTGAFVTLYSKFGEIFAADDGFEEWAVQSSRAQFSISGRKFNDQNGDGTDNGGSDPGLAGWTIYLDADNDNVLDPGEPSAITGAGGAYTLSGLAADTYTIREVAQAGWIQTFPAGGAGQIVEITEAGASGINFGNVQARPAIDIEKFVNLDDADTPTGPILAFGSTADFVYAVTNPGNVPLSSVVVADDNGTAGNSADDFLPVFLGGDTDADGLLDPGEVWAYSATRTVVAGQYTNIGSVTGTHTATQTTVTDSDPANYFGANPAIRLKKFVEGQDADTPTGPLLLVGTTAIFTYQVTNIGNVPLGSVVVSDDNGTPGNTLDDLTPIFQSGDANTNGQLDLGEVWLYSATRTVTPGQYTNIGSVTATSPIDTTVSATDPANHFGAAPAINIEKLVNGQDADSPTGPLLAVGSTATFTYLVTNPGNVFVGNVVVTDDNGTPLNSADDFIPAFVGGDTDGDNFLDPGETWTYTATRIVTAGQYTNIGRVEAVSRIATLVTDTDPANHFGVVLGINIVKLVNGVDANTAPGPTVPVGSTVTFTYVVTNTGNVSLGSIAVRDDNGTPGVPGDDFNAVFASGDADADGRLDLTETWTFTASRIATAGLHTNIATVTGRDPDQTLASDDDAANHFGAAPAIDIEKHVNGQDADSPAGPLLAVGSTATFTYFVTNPGNVPLSAVTVRDDNGTPANLADDFNATFVGGDADANGLLDTTETWSFTASRIVTAGQYTNVGSATGISPTQATVTDTDAANHFGVAAGIDIEKLVNGLDADSPTGPIVPVGSTVTFTYVVTNTGNVALSGLVVGDDNGTPGSTADDFHPTFIGGDANTNGLLDLGETWTYTATRIATAGQYTNVGTVAATSPISTTVSDSDAANHFGAAPAIDIEKTTNGPTNGNPVAPDFDNEDAADGAGVPIMTPGSAVTWTYKVTNAGNVSFAFNEVVIVDDSGTPGTTSDDLSTTGGQITFLSVQTGDADNVLEPGEVWLYTASGIVQGLGPAGVYENTATVTVPGDSDSDLSHYRNPPPVRTVGIDLEKMVNGDNADLPTGPILPVGGTAVFTYFVTNTGDVPLSNVIVRDDHGTLLEPADDFFPAFVGGDANGDGLLDPGEVWLYESLPHTVTAGQYTNIGLVTGIDAATQTTASASDAANHFGAAPAIDLEKFVFPGQDGGFDDADVAPGPFIAVGATATFNYIVTNRGNVALSGVTVVDDAGTPANSADDFNAIFVSGDVNANGLLDLTETWTFTASRIVTAGLHTNVGTVRAEDSTDTEVTDTDVANHTGAISGVNIEKLVNGEDADAPDGPTLPVGSTVTFTFIVTNTGNVPLGEVFVLDDNATPGLSFDDFSPTFVGGDIDGDGRLDVDETWIYIATGVVTPGQHTNIAVVTATSPTTTVTSTDSDPANFVGGGGGGGTIVIGPDKTNASLPFIHVVDATTGEVLARFLAYDQSFRGGVRVATGDVNGDGVAEIITAPGRGHAPLVRIWDQEGNLLHQFLAFGKKFKGGVDIAVGNVVPDEGQLPLGDIAVAMSAKGSQVRVFDNRLDNTGTLGFSPFSSLNPFGKKFNGGATVELADMGTASTQGGKHLDSTFPDGRAEILVGNEAGMRSTVKTFTFFGASKKAASVRTFQPFAASFRGGLSLDVARVNDDSVPDIIVGTGNGGGSQVQILDGVTRLPISSFTAFTELEATPSHNAPVDVAALDENLDGIAETILVAQGTDGKVGEIRAFDALTGTLKGALPESAFDTVFNGNPIDDFANAYFLATLESLIQPPGDEQLVDEFFQNYPGV